MTKEEVKISVGVDNSSVARDLSAVRGQFKAFGKNIQDGMKWFGRFNMLFQVVDKFEEMSEKAKELGQFWGAFTVGGAKAVQEMGRLEAVTEEVTKNLKEARKAQDDLNKAVEDSVLENGTEDQKVAIRQKRADEAFKKFIATTNPSDKEISSAKNDPDKQNSLLLARVEHRKAELELIKAQQELNKQANDRDKKYNDEEEEHFKKALEAQQKQIEKAEQLYKLNLDKKRAEEDIAKQNKDFKRDQISDYIPTIESVANSRSTYSGEARDYLNAQNQAKSDFLNFGLDKETQRKIDYADSLKKPLEKAGFLGPQETIAEATKASARHLEDINRGIDKLNNSIEPDGDTK